MSRKQLVLFVSHSKPDTAKVIRADLMDFDLDFDLRTFVNFVTFLVTFQLW